MREGERTRKIVCVCVGVYVCVCVLIYFSKLLSCHHNNFLNNEIKKIPIFITPQNMTKRLFAENLISFFWPGSVDNWLAGKHYLFKTFYYFQRHMISSEKMYNSL